jgi:toxin ParE1/3/4
MGRILRTNASHEDYRDVWYYIALDNVEAANGVVRAFDAALTMLSENPRAGRRRARLAKNLRSFPVGEYILFYRPLQDGVELIRVIRGSRQLGGKCSRSDRLLLRRPTDPVKWSKKQPPPLDFCSIRFV